VVTLLLASGANIEASDEQGSTPLHYASVNGNSEIVSLLLANGAKADVVDKDGNSPLQLAKGRGHKDTVGVLERGRVVAVPPKLADFNGTNTLNTPKAASVKAPSPVSTVKATTSPIATVSAHPAPLKAPIKNAEDRQQSVKKVEPPPTVAAKPKSPTGFKQQQESPNGTKASVENVQVVKASLYEDDIPYDINQLRDTIKLTAALANSLAHQMQAHDEVLDILVNKTKECPSLVMLIPCKRKWKDWLSPTLFTQDKFMLTFICPVSLCVVECGPKGTGWEVSEPKKWVKKWGPALLVTLKVLQVAMVAGRLLGLPIPYFSCSAESLGLGGDNMNSTFVSDFMSSSWNQIAYYTAEKGFSQASASLSESLQSSIPSLDEASLKCALLQCSDHAYQAIHTFVQQFGAIEDLLRGKMSRQRYGKHVEWISDEMVDTWKEQLRNRELESCISLPAAPIVSMPPTKELPPSSPLRSVPQPEAPSSFPWLSDKLSKTTQISPTDISKIVQILVREGIDSESVLSGIEGKDFTAKYLKRKKIKASAENT